VKNVGSEGLMGKGDDALLAGIRAACYTSFAMAVAACVVVVVAFRGAGKVGAHKK